MESPHITSLIEGIDDNLEFFDKTNKFHTLNLSLCQLKLATEKCVKGIEEIRGFAFEYDFDDETHGNGFRSFLNISDSAIKKSSKVCQRLIKNRDNCLFSADTHAK